MSGIDSPVQPPHTTASTATRYFIVFLLVLHAILLGWSARTDSPTWDEVAHFAAGLEHWRHGSFRLFAENPPLVRLVVMGPISWLDRNLDPDDYPSGKAGPGERPEFGVGAQIARKAGIRYFLWLTLARLAYIPFSLLGTWICYRWARELWGNAGGLIAAVVWALSPTALAYGHIITPDLGAAAMGVTSIYGLRRWLLRPTLARAVLAGVLLGLTELTKTTWIVLIPLWPALWILYRAASREAKEPKCWTVQGLHVAMMMLIAIWILNLGYGFEGTFTRLGDYRFVSPSLSGAAFQIGVQPPPGNRFAASRIGAFPVPLPKHYVWGIDYIRMELEIHRWSYLRGEWRLGGWWYYYIYALLVKETIGHWLLLTLAGLVTFMRPRHYSGGVREEALVLLPLLAVLGLLSTQTGFSHHVRYALPLFPFGCIWLGKVGRSFSFKHKWVAVVACLALGGSIVSSLRVFPHSMSYFNELAGGPKNGYKHLSDSNVDWGQDLFYLKSWYDRHPDARPLHLIYDLALIDPALLGIEGYPVPVGPTAIDAGNKEPGDLGPKPGWYCLSIKHLQFRERRFEYFRELEPVDWVGYTMPVYHITIDEADAIRRRHGLPSSISTPVGH